jgi:hypothetical protein
LQSRKNLSNDILPQFRRDLKAVPGSQVIVSASGKRLDSAALSGPAAAAPAVI